MDKYKVELIEAVEDHLEDEQRLHLKEWNELKKANPRLAEEIFKVFCLREDEFEQVVENKGITLIDIKNKILYFQL